MEVTLGTAVMEYYKQAFKKKRISILNETKLKRIEGEGEIKRIIFQKEGKREEEFFIDPDMVIQNGELGMPNFNLMEMLQQSDKPSEYYNVTFNLKGIPQINPYFQPVENELSGCLYMAGNCTQYPSFLHKKLYRTSNIKYNTEQGYFAAMAMLDKRVRFQTLNIYNVSIGEGMPAYFIGERNSPSHEVIIERDEKDPYNKFVAYYVYGDEICGMLTFGFTNLHIYLHEAMKQFCMPTAT